MIGICDEERFAHLAQLLRVEADDAAHGLRIVVGRVVEGEEGGYPRLRGEVHQVGRQPVVLGHDQQGINVRGQRRQPGVPQPGVEPAELLDGTVACLAFEAGEAAQEWPVANLAAEPVGGAVPAEALCDREGFDHVTRPVEHGRDLLSRTAL